MNKNLIRQKSGNCGCKQWSGRTVHEDSFAWSRETRELLGLNADAVKHLEQGKAVSFTAYGEGCLRFFLEGLDHSEQVFYAGYDIAPPSELHEAWERLHRDQNPNHREKVFARRGTK